MRINVVSVNTIGVAVLLYVPWLCSQNRTSAISGEVSDPQGWVDLSAFERPEAGFLGNLGRNTIRGPDRSVLDFSVVKRVPLTPYRETAEIDIRMEFFNLLNRTNFHLPAADQMEIFTPDSRREEAGQITSAGHSRVFQFGPKLQF